MSNDNERPAHGGNFLTEPFDLSHTPATMIVEQCPGQNTALLAVTFAPDSDTDEESRFNSQVHQTKSLGYFQRLYEGQRPNTAIDLLSKRTKIDYRSGNYTTESDSTEIAWDLNQHYLDMMVCVGSGLGLGAMIPNQSINSLYQLDLDFGHPVRTFTTKYVELGFNPKNSMLWIGKTPTSEDIWIAWVPTETIEDEEDVDEVKNTRLSEHHYRATVMFFATMLSRIGYRDIIVREMYPDLSSQTEFLAASNIM
jgi:hypothetical protein